jgi:hypothetical protein
MKKLIPVLLLVAFTAGCGSGVIQGDCDSSHENFCDANTLYRVDLCGNAVPLGQCEQGCNLEFNGCRSALRTVATGAQTIPADLRDLPRIEPYDR